MLHFFIPLANNFIAIVFCFLIFRLLYRLANGKFLLAEEDYVDYYNNIVTLKVKSDDTLKPVECCLSPIETVEGVVIALGREFYTCKLSKSNGLIRKDYPYFGCELLVSSTCIGREVSISNRHFVI